VLLGWSLVHDVGTIGGELGVDVRSRSWLDEWLLADALLDTFNALGIEPGQAQRGVDLVKILTANSQSFATVDATGAFEFASLLISDRDVQRFIGANRYENVLWFNAESWEELLQWLVVASTILLPEEAALQSRHALAAQWQTAAKDAGYQVVKLLEQVRSRNRKHSLKPA
jgi:hypothetical protein